MTSPDDLINLAALVRAAGLIKSFNGRTHVDLRPQLMAALEQAAASLTQQQDEIAALNAQIHELHQRLERVANQQW